jgi:hypothetical protein
VRLKQGGKTSVLCPLFIGDGPDGKTKPFGCVFSSSHEILVISVFEMK